MRELVLFFTASLIICGIFDQYLRVESRVNEVVTTVLTYLFIGMVVVILFLVAFLMLPPLIKPIGLTPLLLVIIWLELKRKNGGA